MKDDSKDVGFWLLFRAMASFFAGIFGLIFALFDLLLAMAGSKAYRARVAIEDRDQLTRLSSRYDTNELSGTVKALIESANFPKPKDFLDALYPRIGKAIYPKYKKVPVESILEGMVDTAGELYLAEGLNEVTPLSSIASGSIEAGRYRDYLLLISKKAKEPEKTIDLMARTITSSIAEFAAHLPPFAMTDKELERAVPTVPLIDIIKDTGRAVNDMVLPFFEKDVVEMELFSDFRARLDKNQYDASPGNVLVNPQDYKGTPEEIVKTFLGGTPLRTLFDAQIPFEIPASRLLEHCVLVAGSGHGKTQTLGAMITRHLEQEDPPALVVVDSTGALVKKIQTLALFNDRLRDRIVIIDPEHDPVPALNMFDVSNPRLQGYSQSVRDEVETEIVSLFNYIFTSAQNDLTSRQGTVFSYVVRLVLSMPGSTIHTLRQVLEEDPKGGYANSRYRPNIEKLDETAQDFFKNQYFELKGFREQIAQRVYSLVQVPAFQRMFSSTNKIDFFEELQTRGSIILVNTSERLLKENASPLFGRYIIARTLASVFERAGIPENKRRPTFLIIDEAAPYFDDTFDKLLTRVRQFKLGVCVAFQHMEQASEKLRSSIASNTSVKLAGGLGYTDSRWLARDMETTPEFLKAQRRASAEPPRWTELACYVRNFTSQAVSLTIPFYMLENMPQMTEIEHNAMLKRNRARVSSPPSEAKPPPASPPSAPPAPKSPPRADSDAASDWA